MKCVLALLLAAATAVSAAEPDLIPLPREMTAQDGFFTLQPATRILADSASRPAAVLLAARLRQGTGYAIPVKSGKRSGAGVILLTTAGSDPRLGPEGYELTVTPNEVTVRAPGAAGIFYGTQTLLQLLPPEIFASNAVAGKTWQAPCVAISDAPRFQWRGLMLDVARHFFTKPEVEQIMDVMALHKLNVLHLHLVDDQGWRIEIKRYPRLTSVGAWRSGINFGLNANATTNYGKDGRYGGYYTQKDIRDLVRYGEARHITIVPEIEMPGHSSAALSAYPELSCTGGPFNTDMTAGVHTGVYCAGNDDSYKFLQGVLTEVFALFPSKYVHVGGDEVPYSNWLNCPKCEARMKAEHLQSGKQLESYFIRRMEKFINAHGKTLIGWSEIRDGGLAQNAAVMDWIGGAVEAASAGHNVVMTPTRYCYLDHYQSHDRAAEPKAIGGFLSLQQVYGFEPIPAALPSGFDNHILGAQGNLWTEYIPNIQHAEYMIFPRELALAEVDWSPKSSRNFDDFLHRLDTDDVRLDEMGINYRRHPTDVGNAP